MRAAFALVAVAALLAIALSGAQPEAATDVQVCAEHDACRFEAAVTVPHATESRVMKYTLGVQVTPECSSDTHATFRMDVHKVVGPPGSALKAFAIKENPMYFMHDLRTGEVTHETFLRKESAGQRRFKHHVLMGLYGVTTPRSGTSLIVASPVEARVARPKARCPDGASVRAVQAHLAKVNKGKVVHLKADDVEDVVDEATMFLDMGCVDCGSTAEVIRNQQQTIRDFVRAGTDVQEHEIDARGDEAADEIHAALDGAAEEARTTGHRNRKVTRHQGYQVEDTVEMEGRLTRDSTRRAADREEEGVEHDERVDDRGEKSVESELDDVESDDEYAQERELVRRKTAEDKAEAGKVEAELRRKAEREHFREIERKQDRETAAISHMLDEDDRDKEEAIKFHQMHEQSRREFEEQKERERLRKFAENLHARIMKEDATEAHFDQLETTVQQQEREAHQEHFLGRITQRIKSAIGRTDEEEEELSSLDDKVNTVASHARQEARSGAASIKAEMRSEQAARQIERLARSEREELARLDARSVALSRAQKERAELRSGFRSTKEEVRSDAKLMRKTIESEARQQTQDSQWREFRDQADTIHRKAVATAERTADDTVDAFQSLEDRRKHDREFERVDGRLRAAQQQDSAQLRDLSQEQRRSHLQQTEQLQRWNEDTRKSAEQRAHAITTGTRRNADAVVEAFNKFEGGRASIMEEQIDDAKNQAAIDFEKRKAAQELAKTNEQYEAQMNSRLDRVEERFSKDKAEAEMSAEERIKRQAERAGVTSGNTRAQEAQVAAKAKAKEEQKQDAEWTANLVKTTELNAEKRMMAPLALQNQIDKYAKDPAKMAMDKQEMHSEEMKFDAEVRGGIDNTLQ